MGGGLGDLGLGGARGPPGGPGGQLASWRGRMGGPREPPGGAAGQNCALAQPASWREATATGQAAPGPAARMARHTGCGARGPLVEPREGRGRKGEEGPGKEESVGVEGCTHAQAQARAVTYYIQKPRTWAMMHGLVDAVVGGWWPGPPFGPPYVRPATREDAAGAPPRHLPAWASRQLSPGVFGPPVHARQSSRTSADGCSVDS